MNDCCNQKDGVLYLWSGNDFRFLSSSSKSVHRIGKIQATAAAYENCGIAGKNVRALYQIVYQFNAGTIQPINQYILQLTLNSMRFYSYWTIRVPLLIPRYQLLYLTWTMENCHWTVEDWCCVMFSAHRQTVEFTFGGNYMRQRIVIRTGGGFVLIWSLFSCISLELMKLESVLEGVTHTHTHTLLQIICIPLFLPCFLVVMVSFSKVHATIR